MKRVRVQYPASNEYDWARGCAQCKFGIANAPELTRACELYMERLILAIDKQITFCACKAGERAHAYLLNRRQIAIDEVKATMGRDDMRRTMPPSKLLEMHPDIAGARKAILHSYEMAKVPTIRYVEPVPAPPPTVHAAQAAQP